MGARAFLSRIPIPPSVSREQALRRLFERRRTVIRRRLREFAVLGRTATEEELFAELAFCLLTPQSSAHRWDEAVRGLRASGLLFRGSSRQVAAFLRRREEPRKRS